MQDYLLLFPILYWLHDSAFTDDVKYYNILQKAVLLLQVDMVPYLQTYNVRLPEKFYIHIYNVLLITHDRKFVSDYFQKRSSTYTIFNWSFMYDFEC